MPKGVYMDEDWVLVAYEDGQSLPMHREDYETIGYWPLFEELQSKAEFEARSILSPTRSGR